MTRRSQASTGVRREEESISRHRATHISANRLSWIQQLGLWFGVFHVTVNFCSPQSAYLTKAEGALGIPGSTQTISGYDTELGKDAICWSSFASATPEDGIPFPNGELVKNFSMADKIKLLPSCPEGTQLEAFAPPEFRKAGFRPRTLEWYTYTVKGAIDMSQLDGVNVVSDKGPKIAIAIIACDSERAGFCSPFVHEQANLREAKEKAETGYTLYPPKKVTGDRHGGSHVHAPAVLLDLVNTTSTTTVNGSQYTFVVQVPMIINDPGQFFVIGTLQFFTGDAGGDPKYRYDVANALALQQSDRLVNYQNPAEVLVVSMPIQVLSYICIGMACMVIAFLLYQSIKHYKSQVLQISQAPFLVVFLMAALIATASSSLFQPRSDLWCRLAQPLVLISLQMLYAVTLGRLWRIHAVVSPLLRNRLMCARSLKKGLGGNSGVMTCFPSRGTNIRKEVNNSKVVVIVVICCLPQIILQVLGLILQPMVKSVEYNDDESIGRCFCDAGVQLKNSIQLYSLCVLGLLLLILLIMAHIARQLPSLLNESRVIYDSTLTSVLLTILGLGVIALTNSPTTSPDVSYMVHVILVLSITLNSSLRIMLPKLKLVWNGQVILVSKLVSDHRQSLASSYSTDKNSLMHNVTGINPTSGSILGNGALSSLPNSTGWASSASCAKPTKASTSETESHSIPAKLDNSFKCTDTECTVGESKVEKFDSSTSSKMSQDMKPDQGTSDQGKHGEHGTSAEQPIADGARPPPIADAGVSFKDETEPQKTRAMNRRKKVILREGETPSKKLTMKMLDLQQELDVVTNHIMSGLSVDRDEWEKVRSRTEQLVEVFSLIQFDWEKTDQSKEAKTLDV